MAALLWVVLALHTFSPVFGKAKKSPGNETCKLEFCTNYEVCKKPKDEPQNETEFTTDIPFLVRIITTFSVECTAIVIHVRHLVTYADCCLKFHQRKLNYTVHKILLFDQAFNIKHAAKASISPTSVATCLAHEAYNSKTHKNDIGILTTKTNMLFTSWFAPTCLPWTKANTWPLVGTGLRNIEWALVPYSAYGWINSETVIVFSRMEVLSQDECKKRFAKRSGPILESDMCLQNMVGCSSNPKYTQLGGVFNNDGNYSTLVGLRWASFCIGGAVHGHETLGYTRITSLLPWIKKNTPGALYCI